LYERDSIMGATSSASSKLLHGGLRYLETGQFRLVREALHERDCWLKRVPHLAHPLPLVLPVYKAGRRPRWMLRAGMKIYDALAGESVLPQSRWLDRLQVLESVPDLVNGDLIGGYRYHDGQMDDRALGLWVAEECRRIGVVIVEGTAVSAVGENGHVIVKGKQERGQFDHIVNAAGPWAEQLLIKSKILSNNHIDPFKGSHVVVDRQCSHALILEVPWESRVCFVLPWKGLTMIGTTEQRQNLDDPVICTVEETDYLIAMYNHYFKSPVTRSCVVDSFAGIRPLLRSSRDPNKASRDHAIQRNGRITSIFGGKWTTATALAEKITSTIVRS